MSCPDWNRLLVERDRGTDGEPGSEWPGALQHLNVCPGCRSLATSADPTLLFAGAAPLEIDEAEVAGIIGTVKSMRSARRIEQAARRPSRRRWNLAAAVGLLAAGLLLVGDSGRRGEDFLRGGQRVEDGWLASINPTFSRSLMPAALPVVEGLERPQARIYQLRQDDLSIVMVFDESLDL